MTRVLNLPDDPQILRWFADEAQIRDAHWHPGPDDVVLDIGCHIGSYTLPALAAGARVYAVDPSVAFTDELSRLVGMNPQLDRDRLTIINQAMAQEGGYPAEIRDGLADSEWPSMHPATYAVFSTVDRFVGLRHAELTRLDWVKIDVEGGELSVLRGGLDTWRRFGPVLLIEDHTDVYPFVAEMDSARQCLDLLDSVGYQVQSVRYVSTEDPPDRTPDRTFWIGTPAVTGVAP